MSENREEGLMEDLEKYEEIINIFRSVYSIKLGDMNYETSLKIAEKYKDEGNEFYKQDKLQQACDKYTAAINLKIETKKNAIYYSNRAIVNLKLENTGLTIEDAKKAIEIDPTYIKAYYRRASGYFVLQKYDEALKDYNYVLTIIPYDQDLKDKIEKCKNANKKKLWFDSISSEGRSPETSKQNLKQLYESCQVETTYSGLAIPSDGKISQKWIEELIENMRSNKFIHKKYLLQILLSVREIYQKEQSLINITIPDDKEFTVCGDIHGQFYDLLNIFNINGIPGSDNPYLFNGDFVDRGAFSVECITTLLCYKLLYPESFHLARGNHESRNLNKLYGFEGEVKAKYDLSVYESFCEFFYSLPLAHVLNNKVLVVHGGLFSSDGVKIDDIKKVNRFCEPPEKGIMSEILWSDPCKENGRQASKRGVGLSFGPDIAAKFLDDNKLDLLVRSHEVKQEGYEIEPGERVITVFSAPNYCDQMGNKGALIRFKGNEMKPRFVQYTAVDHPKVPPMRYMNPMMFF